MCWTHACIGCEQKDVLIVVHVLSPMIGIMRARDIRTELETGCRLTIRHEQELGQGQAIEHNYMLRRMFSAT